MREDYSQTLSEQRLNEYTNNHIENNDSDAATLILMFGIVLIICFFPAAMFPTGTLSRR